MNKLALCSALLLCSSLVGAADPVDFSGHWKADSGQLTDTKGTKIACTRIEITLKQTADSLTIAHYAADCGVVKPDWGPSSMTIKDGKTYENDPDSGAQYQTGTLNGDTLITDSQDSGTDYAFNLKLSGGALQSYYGVKNYAGAMVIEGTLKPAP